MEDDLHADLNANPGDALDSVGSWPSAKAGCDAALVTLPFSILTRIDSSGPAAAA